ncbi:MAG: SDR family oxidoreductase [Planctomycetota bacterium]
MGLLEGKQGLVIGIANDRSYAFHMAKAIIEHGGGCAFTHLPGDKNRARTAKAVGKLGVDDAWLEAMDASSDGEISSVFEAYAAAHDRLDFVIHSIAFAEREWLTEGRFIDTPREAYLQAVDISAYTLLGVARAARPQMQRSGGGSILAMSYYGAEKVVKGYNVMGVAKSALESTSRYLASELGVDNIRVNTVSGGYLKTLAASAVGGTDEIVKKNAEVAPLRRNVEGEDVGRTAVYLVSDLSSGVTAENIYVDCGVNTIGV